MGKQLQIRLLPNWAEMENPDGPITFYCTDSENSGALQVSLYAEYKSGKIPNASVTVLIELAKAHGERHNAGELLGSDGGACDLGTYGTAIFSSPECARFQLWYLSNGRDFVLATHICMTEPEPVEIAEAQEIVGMLQLLAE